MGEAKRRREAGEPMLRWQRLSEVPPPDDAAGLVVQVRITCQCARDGRMALPAGRQGGEWVIGSDISHSFEIEAWLRLPPFDMRLH